MISAELFKIFLLFVLFFDYTVSFIVKQTLLVTTNQGSLEGKLRFDRKGGKFYSFTSIPYAKPPIGKLRFMPPEPPDPWHGVLNATLEPPSCYQNKSNKVGTFSTLGQEDCLYLNVFTRELPDESNIAKPVMVFIHGGGFLEGSCRTSRYGPEFLMTEEIVLVTINYRLGTLGFISFEDESLGIANTGLKDQIMALKWVKENINYFGGDSNSVTIFGESAGSSSVEFHTLSPMSKGLFHRAIMQSGSALNPWNNGKVGTANIIAQRLGINATNDKDLLSQLQKLPVDKLNVSHDLVIHEFRETAPVFKSNSSRNHTTFLTNNPKNLLIRGNYYQIPIMIGYANSEGILKQVLENQAGKERPPTNYSEFIPNDLNIEKGSDMEKTLADRLKSFYFSRVQGSLKPEIDAMTDTWFLYGIYSSVRLRLKTSDNPIYFYRFTADTKLNIIKRMNPVTSRLPGASHGDDIGYLFKTRYTPKDIPKGSIEDISISRMVKLWTNFAKYGNPTPHNDTLLNKLTWPAATKDSVKYLEIGNKLAIGIDAEKLRITFWDKVYKEYAKL